MFIYICLFLLASILYFYNPTKRTPLPFIFLVFMILVAGLRDMIGGYDIYIYSQLFEIEEIKYAKEAFESGFVAYYQFLRRFSTDRAFMIFISSLILLSFYFYFFKKYSVWLHFSLFIFFCKFFLMSFVYIRQGMAMVLCIIALHFLFKKKIIVALGIVLVSIFFHKSAAIFLPFVFISNIKFSYIQIFLLGLVITGIGISPLGSVLIGEIGNSIQNEKIINYVKNSSGVNVFYVIEGILILILALNYRSIFYSSGSKNITIYNGILFYGFIILFSVTNGTFVRLSWYYFIFICLGIPIMIINSNKMRMYFRNIVFVYYTALFFRLLVLYDGGDFMPYKSIFQDFERNGRWEHYEYRI